MDLRLLALAFALAAKPQGQQELKPQLSAAQAAQMKLKPGATGKLCIECHTAFEDKLKLPAVHTPVKSGECIGCHNPHAAQHTKLLSAEANRVCATCHAALVPAQAKSAHPPAAKGECTSCHDPHASEQKFQLVKASGALCAGCHKDLSEAASKAKVAHKPVAEGCATCHDPHGSAKAEHLLKKPEPELCASCHDVKQAAFATKHMDFPVAKAGCTTCHDPHGSGNKGLLRDNVHKPVAERQCDQCHDKPAPGKPVTVKRQGAELCRGCHGPVVAAMLQKKNVHWPVLDQRACLNCHNPHASNAPKLIANRMEVVCGACHADTVARNELSVAKHPPVAKGECAKCHDVHGSDSPLFLKAATPVELCGTCHDWQKHSSHPVGEKTKDPRNKNLQVSCLSCHRAHGTEFKHLMPYATVSDLCTKCHEEYKR